MCPTPRAKSATRPITIRRYRRSDAGLLLEAARESTEQVFPWLPWCHPSYSLDHCHAWLEHAETTWQRNAEFNFAIVDDNQRFLGGCGLNHISPEHRVANLGYWVRTSATRKGVATTAVGQLEHYAFTETNLARVEIIVAVGNAPSLRVAEKSGALKECIAHDRLFAHGKSHDAVIYALLRSRYDRT